MYSLVWILEQRDELRNLKKQEKIELRNQSRQIFQKLIDECNQKINPKPGLLVLDEEEEDQQQQHRELLSQKLVDENNFITQFDESALNVMQNVKDFVQKSKNIVSLLDKKEQKENEETFSLYLQKDLHMNSSLANDNNNQQNASESNPKQMFPQVHQSQKQLRSMTHQQKLTKTNFDFQQTYDLELQKKKSMDRTKNSSGSMNNKRYASSSTTNLINAYKQKQKQQYKHLNFKLQSLRNRQNLMLVETKRDK